eukprot:TRINITY_DN27226_c0_g1_i1.p1 TRINITY_DN27226_c0_g1~~TRINITY_DN27226_c0_g1_i1.p1  ORF type:complete len:209 (+),score=85.42 TRINITY_DN27226_c0_g1_i1:63-689(+)
MSVVRSTGRVTAQSAVFLLCDIQERFRPMIWKYNHVIQTANTLLQAAEVLSVPVVITEQYPKALGHTVSELDPIVKKNGWPVIDKTLFSMCCDGLLDKLPPPTERKDVVLFGIEGHVCVQQTSLDLLDRGYNVHCVADGISSSRAYDRNVALTRMAQAGAFTTTSESLLFELLRDKNHAQFKAISAIVKTIPERTPPEEMITTQLAQL